jgi:ribosomal protein S24E
MELTVTQKHENPVLGRTEVQFTIVHTGAGTPSRADIRKAVAAAVGGKEGVVILDWARSDYGRTATRGYAKVYKSKDRAMELETFPVLVRNGLKQAVVKAAATAEAPPAPARREAPKAEAPKKEAAPPKEEKKEAPTPGKEERKAPGPKDDKKAAPPKDDKKAAPPKDEKKPAAKDEKKPAKKEGK